MACLSCSQSRGTARRAPPAPRSDRGASVAPSRAHSRASAMPFQAEMPTSPREVRARARRDASPSSPGAISTVATAMPPPATARPAKLLGDRAVEPRCVGEDQPAVAAHPPAVGEAAFAHRLAHGGAAEHHRLGHEERGALGQIDLDAARKPRAIEQNRLLRQPGKLRRRPARRARPPCPRPARSSGRSSPPPRCRPPAARPRPPSCRSRSGRRRPCRRRC